MAHKSASAIFRTLSKSVISNEYLWANRNADLMLADFGILQACKGM